ncbi:MAG: helix-turn-helix transcriptional regulator [Candidatus Hodarchaeota archaeon]
MAKRIEVGKPCPHKILEKNMDVVDVAVLHRALKGESYKSISKALGIAERSVRNKLNRIEAKGVIDKGKQQVPSFDTISLWEYVFVTFVKLHLPAAVPPVTPQPPLGPVTPTPIPPGWLGAIDELRRNNPLYDKLVRSAFVLIGTEYDVILLITTQSKDEYAKFCSILQGKGIIEKIWGSMVVEWAGYTWNPLAVPDPEEMESSMRHVSSLSARALPKQRSE